MDGKVIIFSAPSGSGKTTIVKEMIQLIDHLAFSISATSRAPRAGEIQGKDYTFLTADEFRKRIDLGHFLEWEEVYPDRFYGTLKSEIERLWKNDKVVIFDVDVIGGLNIKKKFKDQACAIFIMPPDLNTLETRLRNRKTENEASLKERLQKAEYELSFAKQFDHTIINDDLQEAVKETYSVISNFLSR